ncbi:hypothetical protein PsYK624_049650 [Phanerochaete sordida]|uniref:Uncharacterized protein n=1 Tax=Phanerochaete sordida TaxID=48140 RepID=A0A9P3G4A1_9APHY|nr:hypothetical protein PsYK624_049650 [Phanerochaete sordida]
MTPSPTLGSTIGVALFGGLATAIVYGFVCSQCYSFFHSCRDNRQAPVTRNIIAILWLMTTAYIVFVVQLLYWYAVLNVGTIHALQEITWSLRGLIIMTTISDAVVRCCFVHRAWTLDVHKSQPFYPLVVLLLCLFASSLNISGLSFRLKTLGDLLLIERGYYANLTMIVLVDLVTSARLSFVMARNGQGPFQRAGSNFMSTLSYMGSTGLITSVISMGSLVAYATMPHDHVFAAVFLPLSPLYMSMLVAYCNTQHWVGHRLPMNDGELTDESARVDMKSTFGTPIASKASHDTVEG